MRLDLSLIQQWIGQHDRLLDLGCGDGTLLIELQKKHNIKAFGVDINMDNLCMCLNKGLCVTMQDINQGLSNFATQSFDTVVMTYTLQTVYCPDRALCEMLRIGKQGIVTFPNMGYWRNRFHLFWRGQMPKSKYLPYPWYDTENIHLCTIRDFEELCAQLDIRIVDKIIVSENKLGGLARMYPNVFGASAIYRLTQQGGTTQ